MRMFENEEIYTFIAQEYARSRHFDPQQCKAWIHYYNHLSLKRDYRKKKFKAFKKDSFKADSIIENCSFIEDHPVPVRDLTVLFRISFCHYCVEYSFQSPYILLHGILCPDSLITGFSHHFGFCTVSSQTRSLRQSLAEIRPVR